MDNNAKDIEVTETLISNVVNVVAQCQFSDVENEIKWNDRS